MKYSAIPKTHIVMNEPYTLQDFGSLPSSITNSWSGVYGGKPQMGSGKANKYAIVQSAYNQMSRVDSGRLTYPFTWCAWLKKFAHTDTSYPIFLSYGLPYMACNGSGQPWRFSYKDEGGSQTNLYSTTIPSLNTWYHVCATDDGTTLRWYINGVLEDSTTNNMTSTGSSNTSFDIGRHHSNNNYRIHGAIDDVRVYDTVLSEDEIAALASLTPDERVIEITNTGDVIVNGLTEETDWKLFTSFQSAALDPYPWYDSSLDWVIGGVGIKNTTTLDADGWTRYLTTIDTSTYTRYRGYMQFFYSSSPIGYIYKNLPTGYSKLRVRWGNWYSGTSYLDLNGSNVQSIGGDGGHRDFYRDISGGETIRFRESGITWPGEIWVGNPKTEGDIFKEKVTYNFVKNTGITSPRLLSDNLTFEYPGNLIIR